MSESMKRMNEKVEEAFNAVGYGHFPNMSTAIGIYITEAITLFERIAIALEAIEKKVPNNTSNNTGI